LWCSILLLASLNWLVGNVNNPSENHAFIRDLRWLTQNLGRKHDPAVFHDVVNRFMADSGENERRARLLALETMNKEFMGN